MLTPPQVGLLIALSLMLQPTAHMSTARVMMRPMDDAAFMVPFVFTIKLHSVTALEIGNARREIDIVRDQERLTIHEFEDEALVAAAFIVIRQHLADDTLTRHLQIAFLIGEGMGNNRIAIRAFGLLRRNRGGG